MRTEVPDGRGAGSLGALLRAHRQRRGLTQEELAERVGSAVSLATIGNVERDRTVPYRHTLDALADALGLGPPERAALQAARRGTLRAVPASAVPPAPVGGAIPVPLTPIFGRERTYGKVAQLLRSGARLVTLTGPGGVGKTRLALALLADLREDFPGGVVWVDLAALRDASLVLPALGRALGMRVESERLDPERLAGHLAGRRVLLALDNLEQVAAAAPGLAVLLQMCPSAALLATSRVPLRVRGEQPVQVPPLPLPEFVEAEAATDAAGLAALERVPAVALFVERARAARPGFRLDAENARVVAGICARLDGLPLALELAAARLALFTPQELLDRLSPRLPLLVGGARDLPARHQTLASTISWSYDLLTPTQQELFAQLAVFAGGCNVAAAEAVCGSPGSGGDVLSGLTALAEHSLLRLAPDATGVLRVQLLETVQEYAADRLVQAGSLLRLRGQHAAYFLGRARTADAALHGPRQLAELVALEADLDNMRAALAESLRADSPALGLRLAGSLVMFWWRRGYLQEGRQWLVRVLAQARAHGVPPDDRAAEAAAVTGLGLLLGHSGDRVAARERLEEAVALWRMLDQEPDVLRGLAQALAELGRNGRENVSEQGWAEALFAESLALCLEVGDQIGTAHALTYQASFLHTERGDYEAARWLHEQSLQLVRAAGHVSGIALGLLNLGEVARAEGRDRVAEELYTESLGLFRELDEPWYVSACLHNLAYSALSRSDRATADARLRESLEMHRRLGNLRGVAECVVGLGAVHAASGAWSQAGELLGCGDALFTRLGASLDHTDRQEYNRADRAVRCALPEPEWRSAFERGRARAARDDAFDGPWG